MRLKEEIAIGEKYVKEFMQELNMVESIVREYHSGLDEEFTSSTERAISYLLKKQESSVRAQFEKADKKLAELKKQYIGAFEKESSECNTQLPVLIKLVKKQYSSGSGPTFAITSLIHELVVKYESSADTISQEDKNDLYFELGRHIEVLQKTFKK